MVAKLFVALQLLLSSSLGSEGEVECSSDQKCLEEAEASEAADLSVELLQIGRPSLQRLSRAVLLEESGRESSVPRHVAGKQKRIPHKHDYWVSKGGSVSNRGFSTEIAPDELAAGPNWTWRPPDGGIMRATPLIDAERNIYISSIAGSIYKFSAEGEQLWRYQADGLLPGNPALAEGTVFTVRNDCTVLAIDASSGRELWRLRAGFGAGTDTFSVLAGEGVVVAPCWGEGEQGQYGGSTFVSGLDAKTGHLLWTYRPWGSIPYKFWLPIYNFLGSIIDGKLTFADVYGGVYHISLKNASVLWAVPPPYIGQMTTGGAVVGPGAKVYVTSNMLDKEGVKRGLVSAYDLDDGELVWRKQVQYAANSGPAVGRLAGLPKTSVVVAIGPNPGFPQPDGKIYDIDPLFENTTDLVKPGRVLALDAASGKERWSFDFPDWHGAAAGDSASHLCLPDSFANPVIGGDGTVYVAGASGKAYALADRNKSVTYFDTKNGFQGVPAVGPGMLVLAPCDGLRVFLSPSMISA